MHLSSCKHPDEPGVYGSETKLAFFSLLTRTFHVVENPSDLGCTEICVDDESCLAADKIGASVFLEAVAEFGCPSVLPYDCIVDRCSCFSIPYDGGFSLVCDTDCCDVLAVDVDGSDGFCDYRCL